MQRQLIILRTHKADQASLQAFDLYDALAGFDTVFCVDERAGQVDMDGRAKTTFDIARLAALGLYAHPECGWQCGDYFYHVARTDRPDYDFYWLIEPDVRVNTRDLAAFFAQFDNNTADLLAPRLTFNDATWSWNKQIIAAGLPPWRCFFPITRLSGRAVDHVFAVRRRHTRDPAIAGGKTWPNDEAITASALVEGGFDCRDLNQDSIVCHTGASLNGVALVDPAVLAAIPPDGLIYHPVRDFAVWLAGALETVDTITRDMDDAAGTPPKLGRIAGQARTLTRIAQTLLRHPDHVDAALYPSMLGRHLWESRPAAPERSDFTRDHDERTADLCSMRLATTFGVTQHRCFLGTAHLARCRQTLTQDPASADDVVLGPGFPLGRFPRAAALPYAWDLASRELLLTVHADVAGLLEAPALMRAQRAGVRVGARIGLGDLARVYGAAGKQRDRTAQLLLAAAPEDDAGLARLVHRLRTPGSCVAVLPGAASQLAALPPQARRDIPAPMFDALLRFTIEPFRHVVHPAGWAAPRCVVVPESLAGLAARVFPAAGWVI